MRPALLAAAWLGGGALLAAPASFVECEERTRSEPGNLAAYRWYLDVARRGRNWSEAARRLEARLAVEPGDHLARLVRAEIAADRGESVASSLAAAQREVAARGAPSAAWAGVVVLGDGSWAPFPQGLAPRAFPWLPAIAAPAAVLDVARLARRRRQAPRGRASVTPSPGPSAG